MSARCQFIPGGRSWAPEHEEEARYPRAARILLYQLKTLARKRGYNRLEITDGMLAQLCGHGVDWVQKGLRQLVGLGEIERKRGRGRRFITLLGTYAGGEVDRRSKPNDRTARTSKGTATAPQQGGVTGSIPTQPAEIVPFERPTAEQFAAFKQEIDRTTAENRRSSRRRRSVSVTNRKPDSTASGAPASPSGP